VPVGPALGQCEIRAVVVRASGTLVALCQDTASRSWALETDDGLDWTVNQATGLVPTSLAPVGAGRVAILAAMTEESDGTLVAVGADALDDLSTGNAAAWTSPDGVAWTPVAPQQSMRDGEMLGLIATTSGILAVGANGYPGANVQWPGLRGPAIWRSADGLTWERAALANQHDPELLEGIATTSGGFVAWGGAAPPGTGAVWVSTDGEAWSRSINPAGDPWGPIGRILQGPGNTLIAAGSAWPKDEEDPRTGLWKSTDGGRSWASTVSPAVDGAGALRDAVLTGGRAFAAGGGGRVLESADGETWTALPTTASAAATIKWVVSLRDALIGFGSIETADASTPGIWRFQIAP
jgi:hypothetical protein